MSAVSVSEVTAAPPAGVPRTVPIGMLVVSKTNPRRSMDATALAELTDSVRKHGILQPLLVRPYGSAPADDDEQMFELVAGHRRLAAARAAELGTVPVMTREMSDVEVLEVQLVENLQRADLHPLEEAEGYRQLNAVAKYDVQRIAEKVGRSAKYIYDRMKLLALSKEAKELFLEEEITAGHAILLARLKPADQLKVIKEPYQGLFQAEHSLFTPEEEKAGRKARKACSVRELEAWIDKHVRFDPKAPDPMLFPEAALRLAETKKAVPITFGHYVHEDARDGRTYTEQSWKRADGEKGSKTCEHSVLGYVAAGAGRGRAFEVCVNKDKCTLHWASVKRARARRSVSRDTTAGPAKKTAAQAEKEKLRSQTINKAAEAIRDAVLERAAKMSPEKILRTMLVLNDFDTRGYIEETKLNVGRSDKAVEEWAQKCPLDHVLRAAAFMLEETTSQYVWADAFGIDGQAIHDRIERELIAAAKGGTKTGTPGTCSKCGCTEDQACEGGCTWANEEETICSSCAVKPARGARPRKRGTKAKQVTPAKAARKPKTAKKAKRK